MAVSVHPGEVVRADAVAPEHVKQAPQSGLRLAVDRSKRRHELLDGGVDCGVCGVRLSVRCEWARGAAVQHRAQRCRRDDDGGVWKGEPEREHDGVNSARWGAVLAHLWRDFGIQPEGRQHVR